jgi:PII-like signaling protein
VNGAMKIEGPGKLLRIFIGEADRWHGRSLAEAIVLMLRKEGLAGATVIRGVEGFGADSRIHSAHILRLSEDLPIVVEVVDREDRIRQILPKLDEMVTEGLVCVADVDIVMYRHSGKDDPSG